MHNVIARVDIVITTATQEHLIDIQRCANDAYSKYIARIGQQPAPMLADFSAQISSGMVYIAQTRHRCFAGFIVFSTQTDALHIENVAVIPAVIGTGVGRKLIEFAEEFARNQKLTSVDLYTNQAMTENLIYYPKLGYQKIGQRCENGFDRVYFQKTL